MLYSSSERTQAMTGTEPNCPLRGWDWQAASQGRSALPQDKEERIERLAAQIEMRVECEPEPSESETDRSQFWYEFRRAIVALAIIVAVVGMILSI